MNPQPPNVVPFPDTPKTRLVAIFRDLNIRPVVKGGGAIRAVRRGKFLVIDGGK